MIILQKPQANIEIQLSGPGGQYADENNLTPRPSKISLTSVHLSGHLALLP